MKNQQKTHLLLFDLDDTLVDTSDIYWQTKSLFIQLIESLIDGQDTPHTLTWESLEDMFEAIDEKNMLKMGFHPTRYSYTMQEMYIEIAKTYSLELSVIIEKKIKNIANNILNNIPRLIPGAKNVLQKLKKSGNYRLVMVTRGIPEIQEKKINKYNLDAYFDTCFVVDNKNAKLYSDIIHHLGFTPLNTWIIGDSIKSEINPALEIGAHCILYLYYHHTYRWKQEHSEKSTNEGYPVIKELNKIPYVLTQTTVSA